VVSSFREDAHGAKAVVADIEATGGRAVAVCADVASAPDTAALIAAARDRFGPPLVLVNNAGMRADKIALEMSDEAWATVHETNLWGPFRLCRAVLPKMVRARFGRVVNISSVAALHHAPGQANYSASKAGLVGLTKAVAAEVARRGVTVNAVAPGYVRTELTADVSDDVLKHVPLGRWGRPEEIAACVRFLASEEASFVTGATLVADGGYTA